MPYQGKSMLPGIANAPTATSRPGGGRDRNSSIQRLPSTVAGVELMPPGDLVLAELPAQVHLLAVPHRWEVDQASLDVADDDSGALDREQHPADLEERLPDLASRIPAAVRRRGLGEERVDVGVRERVAGGAELAQQRLQPVEKRRRLGDREVALVDQRARNRRFAAPPVNGSIPGAARRSPGGSDGPRGRVGTPGPVLPPLPRDGPAASASRSAGAVPRAVGATGPPRPGR